MTKIRTATPGDALSIHAIYAPIVAHTTISFEIDPPSVPEIAARITTTLRTLPWLASLDEEGALSGYAYASPHRERAAYQWSVDVSAYVREDCRGRGIAKTLYQTLFPILCQLGYFQAFAGITQPNVASVALHEAVGFVPLGTYRNVGYKMGAWRDVSWWQKTLRAPTQPEPLRLFAG